MAWKTDTQCAYCATRGIVTPATIHTDKYLDGDVLRESDDNGGSWLCRSCYTELCHYPMAVQP